MKSDISSFFYYMWNSGNKKECEIIFGDSEEHIWSIWLHSKYNIGSFYGMIDKDCRDALEKRALSRYENDKQINK